MVMLLGLECQSVDREVIAFMEDREKRKKSLLPLCGGLIEAGILTREVIEGVLEHEALLCQNPGEFRNYSQGEEIEAWFQHIGEKDRTGIRKRIEVAVLQTRYIVLVIKERDTGKAYRYSVAEVKPLILPRTET